MQKLPVRQTAYAEYVNSNIPFVLRERGGEYNFKALAEMVGLKPTQHFKRRVEALAIEGVIRWRAALTPRLSLEKVFSYNIELANQVHPF